MFKSYFITCNDATVEIVDHADCLIEDAEMAVEAAAWHDQEYPGLAPHIPWELDREACTVRKLSDAKPDGESWRKPKETDMGEMTLDEARRVAGQWVGGQPVRDLDAALRVILAALPPPEKKTPGQVFTAGYNGEPSYTESVRREAGAAAVLKECAVQPEDVTEEDVRQFEMDGGLKRECIGRVIRRILERKGA